MKKIIKTIAFVLLLLSMTISPLFSVCSGVAFGQNNSNKILAPITSRKNVSLFDSGSPKIYIEAENEKTDSDGNHIAQIGESGYKVGFYIKATKSVSNVKVSWRTRDMTAIASEGDYESKSGTCTLNGTSSGLIYVVVYRNGVATRVDRKRGLLEADNDDNPENEITRNFFIEITDISCDKSVATIDYDRKQLIATAGSEYTFSVTKIYDKKNSNIFMSYFSSYYWTSNTRHPWALYAVPKNERVKNAIYMDKSPNIQDGGKFYSDAVYPSMGIFNEFISRGYADLYATIWADTYEDKWVGSSDNIRVGIVYADNHEYICQYDIEYGGWSSEHTYDMLQMQTSSRYTTNPGKVFLGDKIYRTYNDGQYHYRYREEYWEVKDPNRRIQVEFWDYEDYEGRYFYDVNVNTIIADTKAPEIMGYYLQKEQIKNGDKLGLSVRFSEPVQVIGGAKPTISAIINNTKDFATFNYVSGSGTDTLYFEWDPSTLLRPLDVSSLKLVDFSNYKSITDYSLSMNQVNNPQIFESDDTDSFSGDSSKFKYYDPAYPVTNGTLTKEFMQHNRLGTPVLGQTFNYSVDLRTPSISTDVSSKNVASRYVEIPLTIGNFKSSGTIYYSWNNSTLPPTTFDNSVTNVEDYYVVRASNMNGRYYLHIYAISDYGKDQTLTVGPFFFDDSPPEINIDVSGNLASRTFTLDISDGEENAGWVSGITNVSLIFTSDKEGKNVVKTYTVDGMQESKLNKSFVVPAEDFGLGENEFGTYYAFVSAEDNLGNKSQTEPALYKFDRRTFFDVEFVSAKSKDVDKVLDISTDDFKVIDITEGVWLKFLTSDTSGATPDFIAKNANNEKVELYKAMLGVTSKEIYIESDFAPGFYTITFTATESGTVKYSQETMFYFTKNMQDEGLEYYEKINKGLLLTNNVYQIDNDLPYYFMDRDGNIQTEKYGSSSKPATFSSKNEAIKFLKFMEYQDLYPIRINQSQADLLNGKSSLNFLKANGETMVAEPNQIWIRYKTTAFDKDPTTSQWAYYYYKGDTLTIKQEYLSDNLLSTIGTISERLAKNYGKDVVLFGEGNVNQYNEPYLDKDQIHFEFESTTKTKCDISFDRAIFYDGDTKIYDSSVTEGGKTYNIVSNMELSQKDHSKLFYKSRDNSTYTEIDFSKYTNISQIFLTSNVYDFIELGSSGARKYSVYIDKDAPVLTGYMKDADGNDKTEEFNIHSQGNTYTTKSFSFGAISELEKDKFAYVSVWKYLTNKTGELLNVYSRVDLQNNSYILDDGDYHIEVYDRSGNGYSFVLRVNSKNIVCETVEKKDEYILVTCNRDENQIQTYEIYLNGDLLTAKYSQRQKFEQSGVYFIRIVDIFQNVYEYEIDFKREFPTVSWLYYDEDQGGFVPYDSENPVRMRMERESDTTFRIITSSLLQFKYDSLYKYQFTSDIKFTKIGITNAVKINELKGFTLKMSYENYKEATITYIVEIDDKAPIISVKNEIEKYNYAEIEGFNNQLESGNVGDILKYASIKYSKRDILNSYLTSGDNVWSRMLKVSATDNYGVSLLKIYLNGKLLIEEKEAFSNIVLSRFGEYKIEAFDNFGNKSEFVFTNNVQNDVQYFVDGNEFETNESCLQYFTENDFSKIEYGKKSIELLFKTNCIINFKITSSKTVFSTLEIKDGKIYFLTYKIGEDGGDKIVVVEHSSAIFDINDDRFVAGEYHIILNKNDCGKAIFAKFDSENNISLKIENEDGEPCTIEGRIDGENEPFYFKAEMSTVKSDVTIKTEFDEIIPTNQEEKQIKTNKTFHVEEPDDSGKIVLVKVYYSQGTTFGDYVLVYNNGTFNQVSFSENGLYLIEIQNVYGVVTKYYILKSENFMATISSELADGTKFEYSGKYNQKVSSNKFVFINAYSENITSSILKDGQPYSGAQVETEKGITVIKLHEDGSYLVSISDEFGNEYSANVQISLKKLTFDDDLIYGYNENALKKSEGYTNKLLSIKKEAILENEICFVSIAFGENQTILLDQISENKKDLIDDDLLSCIGKDGNGKYVVVFRDVFGNAMQKEIHYKKDTTLLLSRTTRSSSEEMTYDIESALSNGFWANNSLIFNTTANQYVLKVDGRKVDCPLTLNFGSGSEEGEFNYSIFYQDEYGNIHEFDAHLFRQKLNLVVPDSIKTIEENGLLATRSNLKFVVPDGATCTYLLDGEEKEYVSNMILKRDGVYRFTVKDLAGNISSVTIKKDTVVEFEMTEIASNNIVINGGIICSDKVSFKALNGDSAFIKLVFKDGVLQKDYDDNKFSGNGKWEIIIADKMGNETYFTFQTILHKLSSFNYTVPYGYKVTEIWYNSGDDVPLSYMQYVEGEGTILKLAENGKYSVVMSSQTTGLTSSFSITINNAKPQIKLVGCNENETTLNDITISGYKVGDRIEVYRNNKLYKSVDILTSQTDAPTITEGGNYTIVVINEAGVETSVSFVRKYIPNTAGNVLIIVLILIAVVIVFIGLVYRQRSKVDE